MADPGFPRRGAMIFVIIFAENCMKMKKNEQGRAY